MTSQPTPRHPSVLFVCVRNAGKSQMAAALMRHLCPNDLDICSAGTNPGPALNQMSRQVVEEIGASMTGEYPKPIDPDLAARADRIIVLGREAVLDPTWTTTAVIEVWDTDEPSARGIDGIERMRLIREDLLQRLTTLRDSLRSDHHG